MVISKSWQQVTLGALKDFRPWEAELRPFLRVLHTSHHALTSRASLWSMSFTQWHRDGALIAYDTNEAPGLRKSEVTFLATYSFVKKQYLLSVCDVPSIVPNTGTKQAQLIGLMRLEFSIATSDGTRSPVQHDLDSSHMGNRWTEWNYKCKAETFRLPDPSSSANSIHMQATY